MIMYNILVLLQLFRFHKPNVSSTARAVDFFMDF